MTRQRKTQITIETERIVVIRPSQATTAVWCPNCAEPSPMLSAEQAAVLAGVSTRTIYALVEAAQLHFTETPEGRLLVCPHSLSR